MKIKTAFFFILLPIMAGTTAGLAQDTSPPLLRPRMGIFGGASVNSHLADFRALPGVPNCCPQFETGSGFGPIIGLLYELPLTSSFLLSFNASYIDHSATLSTREAIAVISGGEIVDGAIDHKIDASLSSIGLEPGLNYQLIEGIFLRGGLRIGLLLSPTYSQQEEIAQPEGTGTFLDSLGNDSGRRIRNARAGEIPDASALLLQGIGGVGIELPLNAQKTLLGTVDASYAAGITDVVEGYSWKPNALRLTLGLKYSPLPAKQVRRDTLYRRDTTLRTVARGNPPSLRLEKSTATKERIEEENVVVEHITITEQYVGEVPKSGGISSTISAVGLDTGREEPAATLRVEEFLQTNTHPLLGYIFFDEGSAEIPDRYVRGTAAEADRFQPKALFSEDAMGISHNVLNIVGYNLRQHPEATLTITGCNANTGVEQGNRTLSRGRAESVKNYLTTVWKIAPERLSVAERDLPQIPSNTRTQEGGEENRRVEISSSLPEVVDVFVAYDTTRTASPPGLRFKPVVRSTEPVTSWKLRISRQGTPLKEFSGSGTPPATVDWNIGDDKKNMPRFSEPLQIELEATDSEGEKTTAQTTLPTDVITIRRKEQEGTKDYRIEQYNLVLFDVGKSTITSAHRRTIDLIKSRLTSGSMVTVEGYSDRTGDADANRRLALGRAQATAKALGRSDANVIGVGEDRLLYTNDIPEGRFYCRTVQITVKTPVER